MVYMKKTVDLKRYLTIVLNLFTVEDIVLCCSKDQSWSSPYFKA